MALELIRTNPDGTKVQFRPDAAASFRRFERRIGRKADVNRTVVSYQEQEDLYNLRQAGKYPYSVASPRVSNHVYRSDTDGGNAWDTDERDYALLAEYGWIAVWNDSSKSPYEPWHLEYFPSRDKHINDNTIPTQKGKIIMFVAAIFPNLHPTLNGWFLVVPGGTKPVAIVLSGQGGKDAESKGIPVIAFDTKNAVDMLTRQVSF